MSDGSAGLITKIKPGSDCTIRSSTSLAASLLGLVNSARGVEIDCDGVEQADITFVQTVVSAERTFAARELSFALLSPTGSVRSAFARAGVPLPGARALETSGN